MSGEMQMPVAAAAGFLLENCDVIALGLYEVGRFDLAEKLYQLAQELTKEVELCQNEVQ
jgi:hypothetical protein